MMAGSFGAVTVLILSLLYIVEINCQAHEGDLRLFDSTNYYSGRVEIYHDRQWGTICDDGWSSYDARVACRQLGFTGTSTARCCAAYGQGSTSSSIWLTYLACDSTEDLLIDCSASRGWGPHYSCSHYEDAGLQCSGATNPVRLWPNATQDDYEGVVEVFVNGRWGSVCADDWDSIDANVLCRQMKYTDAELVYNTSISNSRSGETPVMGNVACSGNEESLTECSHAGWGYFWDHPTESSGTCNNGIAAVKCRLIFGAAQIRLIGGGSNEGTVEVYFDGEWGGICHDHWDIAEGKVACRQKGFPGALNVTKDSSYGQGSRTGRIWLDDMDCRGNEKTLAECDHDGWGVVGTCKQSELAGVICLLTHDGDIRLVGGTSDTHSDGRLEIFHNGQWGSVCSDGWSDVDTLIACRHLGYNSVGLESGAPAPDGASGAWFSSPSCTGNEINLGECNVNYWAQTRQCNNGNYVALGCLEASNKLRLAGGPTNREGNVEIYHNGRWGSICPNNWDINEVSVVCKYLGFSGEGEVRNRARIHESINGPLWLGGLNCTGSESNLAECPHPGWEKNGCNYPVQAGVLCHVAREGDLRLVNDGLRRKDITFVTRGRVEVYHRGAWGLICGRGWDVFDGGVVCRQLGFARLIETGTGVPGRVPATGAPGITERPNYYGRGSYYYSSYDYDSTGPGPSPDPNSGDRYGPGSGEFVLADVDCTGSESSILKCGLNGWRVEGCNSTQPPVYAICSEIDVTPPVIYTCPRDMNVTVEVGSMSKPVFWMEPWAVDDTGITTLLTSSHSPGISINEGTTRVTYLFINAANLIAGCTFDINGIPVDSTPPTITRCPYDIYFPVNNAAATVPVSWNEPSASDISNVTLVSSTATPGTSFSVGSTQVVYDYMDGYSNHAYCNFTVNVIVGGSGQSNVPPASGDQSAVMNCPNNIPTNVELGTKGTPVNWLEPWVTSPTGNGTLLAQTHTSGYSFPVGRTTVTYIFADVYRQLLTCSFDVIGTSVDTMPPVVYQCHSNITQDAAGRGSGSLFTVYWIEPFAIDAGGTVNVIQSHHPRTVFPLGTTTVTYEFRDGSDNIASCVFTVTLSDTTTAPTQGLHVSNCPANINVSVEIGTYGTRVTWPELVANSGSGNVSIAWQSHFSGDIFGVGQSNVVNAFVDGAGQVAYCRFTVTGTPEDTKPPEVSLCPKNQTVEIELGNNSTTCEWIEPVAFDVLGGIKTTRSHIPGAEFLIGLTRVYYLFTDVAGNNSTCEFYVNATEVDTTPPTVHNCPSPIFEEHELDDPLPSVTWLAPTASDLSGQVTMTSSHSPGTVFQVNTTVVTYTFVDAAHTAATCRFEVNVQEVDTRPPKIDNCPSNITTRVELGSPGTPIQWTEPNASDPSNVVNRVLRTHKPGDTFISGTHVVTYLYIDASRNMAKCEFSIRIDTVDTTPPIISQCPNHINTTAPRNGKMISWHVPTAWDMSGNVTTTVTGARGGPGSRFPLGQSTVRYQFTDPAGNMAECSFNVKITGPPVVQNCPTNKRRTIELGDYGTKVKWTEPTLNPDFSSARLLHQSHSPGAYFSAGKTVVSYVYFDTSTYAVASCSFNVTILTEDTKPPAIFQCPSDIERIATSHTAGTIVTWSEPTATDYSNYTQTQSHTPGSRFSIGGTGVNYAFTDVNNNRAVCRFTITIIRVNISSIEITSCPNDITDTVELGTANKPVTWIEPTAYDPLGDVTLFSQSHHSGQAFQVGTHPVTYEFTNGAGHEAVCTFTVAIDTVDTTPPEIVSCPRDMVIEIEKGAWGKSVTWPEPRATDVSGNVKLLYRTHVPGSLFYPGQSLVTYTYTDPSHNLAACSFNINTRSVDTSTPLVTLCPYNITSIVQGTETSAKIYWKTPEAIDLSGDVLAMVASHNPGDGFSVGTTEVVYKFADSAQNSATCSFTVTIETDTIFPPEFNNCPKVIDSTPLKSEQECQATWDEPKASDGTQLLFQTHAPGVTVPSGSSVMVTYVFKKNSHLAPCTFTVKCSKVEQSKQTQQKVVFSLSIAGIVTAVVIAICLLIALLFVCVRRRYRTEFANEFTSPTFTENPFVYDNKDMMPRPDIDTDAL
ncbi:hyalin-like isoform X2 [Amphiura filiformis]|uniref:hyalin-like isoform X2 n=1 Tax=Amphiura filiformis TaxID=82378 RepID=UPI003B219FE6